MNAIVSSPQGSISGCVNVKTFNAKGDGVTNDTNAIQSAINYCQTNNSQLYFPSGIYVVTTLDFGNWLNFSIVGDGPGSAGITTYTGLTVIFSKNAKAPGFDDQKLGCIGVNTTPIFDRRTAGAFTRSQWQEFTGKSTRCSACAQWR